MHQQERIQRLIAFRKAVIKALCDARVLSPEGPLTHVEEQLVATYVQAAFLQELADNVYDLPNRMSED